MKKLTLVYSNHVNKNQFVNLNVPPPQPQIFPTLKLGRNLSMKNMLARCNSGRTTCGSCGK